jgi:glycosyltransferase involved in cell wall biosynthesis
MEPRASVIIRSKNRLPELARLVEIVLAQDAPSFEVVIVDSTEGASDEEVWRALGTRDARIRLLRTPARGCAAAANEGVRQSRGEIVVFVDDDDIPEGRGWLSAHLRNYADPCCLGVNGRMLREDDPATCSPRAARRLLRFGFFKNAYWYAPLGFRVVGISFLMGGNASLRRSAYERGGGWDEFLPYHNECSLFLRLGKRMTTHEYLVYDPSAQMTIRRDIPGGVGQRSDENLHRFVDTLSKYYLWTVAPLFPGRIYGLAPAFVGYFALSTAKNAARYLAEQSQDPRAARSGFWRALSYVPRSLVKHLGTRPRGL